MKRLAILLLVLFLTLAIPSAVWAEDPPTLYEEFVTGNWTSERVYGVNWTAQSFTVGDTCHTMTSVWLSLNRTGVPGYTYLVLRYTDSDLPTGYGLTVSDAVASTTMPIGAADWVEFTFDEYALEAGVSYALCLYAPDGDSTAYVEWEGNSAGGLADGVGSHSSDNGVEWTTDAPVDYLFRIWGYPVMELVNTRVFSNYVEEGDWLITALYYNDFEPYSTTGYAAQYFLLQLVSSNNTVLHQSNIRQWGTRPGSIYLSPDMVSSLEWGGNYTVRMYGTFGSHPSLNHTLVGSDWQGDELLLLDDWVYTSARYIEAEEGLTLLTDTVGQEVLNNAGHVMFVVGVSYLATVRPDIFEWSTSSVLPDAETHNVTTTDINTELGPDLVGVLDDARVFVGVDSAREMGVIVAALAGIAVIAGFAAAGHIFFGVAIAYVGLIGTTLGGITDWPTLGIVTFGAAVIWIISYFINK